MKDSDCIELLPSILKDLNVSEEFLMLWCGLIVLMWHRTWGQVLNCGETHYLLDVRLWLSRSKQDYCSFIFVLFDKLTYVVDYLIIFSFNFHLNNYTAHSPIILINHLLTLSLNANFVISIGIITIFYNLTNM